MNARQTQRGHWSDRRAADSDRATLDLIRRIPEAEDREIVARMVRRVLVDRLGRAGDWACTPIGHVLTPDGYGSLDQDRGGRWVHIHDGEVDTEGWLYVLPASELISDIIIGPLRGHRDRD